MSWLDDITEGDIEEFFTAHGDDTVAVHDLGYGCSTDVSIETLYHMFAARLKLEQENC